MEWVDYSTTLHTIQYNELVLLQSISNAFLYRKAIQNREYSVHVGKVNPCLRVL